MSRHPLLGFSSRISQLDVPGHGSQLAYVSLVGEDFFQTMKIPLLAGRVFTRRDDLAAPKVAVISEQAAMKFFGTHDVLGKTFRFGIAGNIAVEVVGLARDAKYTAVRQDTPATIYVPLRQERLGQANFDIRTAADPSSLAGPVRSAVHEVDGNLPIFEVKTQVERAGETIAQERLFAGLSSSFGGLALVLAAIGLFGVMSYAVARRTTEIAIRMALGAKQHRVLAMVVREALIMVLAGVAIGVPCAYAATRLARTQLNEVLFGLKPSDPLTFALAAVGLLATGVLASYIPARRAASVDPMVALRYE